MKWIKSWDTQYEFPQNIVLLSVILNLHCQLNRLSNPHGNQSLGAPVRGLRTRLVEMEVEEVSGAGPTSPESQKEWEGRRGWAAAPTPLLPDCKRRVTATSWPLSQWLHPPATEEPTPFSRKSFCQVFRHRRRCTCQVTTAETVTFMKCTHWSHPPAAGIRRTESQNRRQGWVKIFRLVLGGECKLNT